MPRRPRTMGLLALLLAFAATPARAQAAGADSAPAADKLDALLRELRATDGKAWEARLQQLEQQAKAIEDAAKKLREQAAGIEQQAKSKDADARRLRAEIERVQQLRALLQTEGPAKAEGSAAAKKPAPMPEAKDAVKEPAMEPAKVAEPPKLKDEAPPAEPVADLVDFARDVAPLFDEHCTACHDSGEQKGGLDLGSFAAARRGGGSNRTIAPGEPDQSRLFLQIAQKERPFMPKDADPLPPAAIATIRRWIEQGAAEDEKSARAFVAAQKKAAAAAAAEASARKTDGGPMPEALPKCAVNLPTRAAVLKSLARSPRAPLLAMPGVQQVLLYDAAMQPLGALPCPLPHVDAVGFSADGALLFAAGGEPGRRGALVGYDVRTGAQLFATGSERDLPLAAAIDRGGEHIALGGSNKCARVLRRDGTECFAGKHDDFVLALAFADDGKWLAAGDRSGALLVWAVDTGRLEATLSGHAGAVDAVAYAGRLLVSAGADGTVRGWDVAAGKERWRLDAHKGQALALAVGPGDRLASCGSDGRIRVFTQKGQAVAQSADLGEWLYCTAFGADGDTVFAGDWQGRLHRFDVKVKKVATTVPLAAPQ